MHEASKPIIDSIVNWMEKFVEKPHPSFGDLPPCPYARQFRMQNKIKIVESKVAIWNTAQKQCNAWDDSFEAVIVASSFTAVPPSILNARVAELNRKMKRHDLVLLEDHPQDIETIDGVQMNHGELVLIVIQRLERLNRFSKILKQGKYYNKWSKENLDDVVNWRFDD